MLVIGHLPIVSVNARSYGAVTVTFCVVVEARRLLMDDGLATMAFGYTRLTSG
jgi:hypothetical protein